MASHVDSAKHLFLLGRMMINDMDGILFSEKSNRKERNNLLFTLILELGFELRVSHLLGSHSTT
jgi:hypothetical protein